MKEKAVSGIVLTLLLISMLASAFFVQPAKAELGTIYIRADGSVDPSTAAIKQAGNTYTLTDNINGSIIVEMDNVVVDGAGYTVQSTEVASNGIDLSGRTNVTVKNTQIVNFESGILLSSSSNNSIIGNNITNNGTGILLDFSSSNNSISANNVTANNGYGISLDSSSNNSISDNNITANSIYGIFLDSSPSNSINGNTFTDDGLDVWDSYQNYVENNTVNGKPLVYLEGVANCSVGDAGQVILVRSDSIRVENLNLSRTSVGVQLWETNNTIISWMNITDNYCGIELDYSSSNNSIGGNDIASNVYGVWLDSSSSNSVSENNITANEDDGIRLISSPNNSIRDNNITANSDNGILLGFSSSNSIGGNNIANGIDAISLASSSSNGISGNNITNNSYGISLYSSSNNSISGNNITPNSFDGVWLYSSFNNGISDNNITANKDTGIWLASSSSNGISGNNITNNSYGVWLYSSSFNNSICDNNITANNSYGICLYSSSGDSVSRNNMANNSYGILLGSSSSNIVSGNKIANNSYGMNLAYSSNSTIYHNSFKNNHVEVLSTISDNAWDYGYPSGGNYWSDYNGTDANYDGIGDVPYVIDANNTDRYPLMGSFCDLNATSEYNVQTICNSTITDFHFNGTAIIFNVSSENGSSGFCRICIPTGLMNATYTVFVNGTEVTYDLLPFSNETNSYLYFTYKTSTQEVTIIPEFSTLTPTLLALITLTVATAVHKRKHPKTRTVAPA